MKKQRFFVIKGNRYSSGKFYFQDLDGAMKMFRLLMEGKATEIDSKTIPPVKIPKKDDYIPDDYFHYIIGEPEYHLHSEIIEIFSKKEIAEISKDRKEEMKALKKGDKKWKKKELLSY